MVLNDESVKEDLNLMEHLDSQSEMVDCGSDVNEDYDDGLDYEEPYYDDL